MEPRSASHGERVLLLTEKGNRYLVTLKRGERFHSEDGVISHDDLAGKPYGSVVTSSTGTKVALLYPQVYDLLASLPRRTQIVYPKDLGLIAFLLDAKPGSLIVEGGTGSGVLALYLATRVHPGGKVISYDLNDEFFPAVRKAAERLGVQEAVELRRGDLRDADVEGADGFVADVPEPWEVVPAARRCLRGGGVFVSIVPSVNQLERSVLAMRRNGIIDLFVGELMIRPWRVREGATRPVHVTRGHTVFVISGRKVEEADVSSWNLKLPFGFR